MPSGLRVVGIGGAPREGFDIEAKKRMCTRGGRILFSGERRVGVRGERARGTHRCRSHSTSMSIRPRPIAMSTSLSITHGWGWRGRAKKRRTRKREKIRLGINADLTADDWSPPIVQRWFAGIAPRSFSPKRSRKNNGDFAFQSSLRRALLTIFAQTARAIKNAPNFTTQKIYYEAAHRRCGFRFCWTLFHDFEYRTKCRVCFFKRLLAII